MIVVDREIYLAWALIFVVSFALGFAMSFLKRWLFK